MFVFLKNMGELCFLKKYIFDFALGINEKIWLYFSEILFMSQFGKLQI